MLLVSNDTMTSIKFTTAFIILTKKRSVHINSLFNLNQYTLVETSNKSEKSHNFPQPIIYSNKKTFRQLHHHHKMLHAHKPSRHCKNWFFCVFCVCVFFFSGSSIMIKSKNFNFEINTNLTKIIRKFSQTILHISQNIRLFSLSS